MHPGNAFLELALLLLACALAGGLFVRLRQPVLIAYIVVGIGVGPAGAGWPAALASARILASAASSATAVLWNRSISRPSPSSRASSFMRAMKGVMPMPAPTQIWRR